MLKPNVVDIKTGFEAFTKLKELYKRFAQNALMGQNHYTLHSDLLRLWLRQVKLIMLSGYTGVTLKDLWRRMVTLLGQGGYFKEVIGYLRLNSSIRQVEQHFFAWLLILLEESLVYTMFLELLTASDHSLVKLYHKESFIATNF